MARPSTLKRRLQRHIRQLTPARAAPLPRAWPVRRWRCWPHELRFWFELTRHYAIEHAGPWALRHALYSAPPALAWARLLEVPERLALVLAGLVPIGEGHDGACVLAYTRAESWPGCGALYAWDPQRPLALEPVAPSIARYLELNRSRGPSDLDMAAGYRGLEASPAASDAPHTAPLAQLPEARLPAALWATLKLLGEAAPDALRAQSPARVWAPPQPHACGPHDAALALLVAALDEDTARADDAARAAARWHAHPTVAPLLRACANRAPLTEGPHMSFSPSKQFELALASVERMYGKGSMVRMDAHAEERPRAYVSTGILALDHALGTGGYPRGAVVEAYGPPACGKTTLAFHAIAEAQRAHPDLQCVYVDAEHRFDPGRARQVGVRGDLLHVVQPDYAEQALEIVDTMVRSNACAMVVVDSVSALVPRAEIEGEMGDEHAGMQAKLMSQAMRKLAGSLRRSQTTLMFLNQLRTKIGVLFGNPEKTSGGHALSYYASMRLDVRRIGTLKDTKSASIGQKVRIKVVKNTLAPPHREAEADLFFEHGFDLAAQLIARGLERGLVQRSGSWYSYEQRLGQGIVQASAALRERPEQMEALRLALLEG